MHLCCCSQTLALPCAVAAARERGTASLSVSLGSPALRLTSPFQIASQINGRTPARVLNLCASPTPAAAAFVWRAVERSLSLRPRLRLASTCPATSCCCCCCPLLTEPPFQRAGSPAQHLHTTHCDTYLRPISTSLHLVHLLPICAAGTRTPETSVGWSPLHRWRPWNRAHATSYTLTAGPTTST